MARLRDRPTGELMVLMVAGTVCGSVIFGGAALVLISLFQPEADTTQAARQIADLLNTLIGLLAGFLAGRTDAAITKHRDHGGEQKKEPE
jgi:NhaP-type Na+/H+ or K+/H+ antiporter